MGQYKNFLLQLPPGDAAAALQDLSGGETNSIEGACVLPENDIPFGSPVPSRKTAPRTRLFEHAGNGNNCAAGQVPDGADMENAADSLMATVLDLASGSDRTCNAINSYRDISLFRDSVIL